MTTTWKPGDAVEFDISGSVSADGVTGAVGCKPFPMSLLLTWAESVSVRGTHFDAVGVKVPNQFVGVDYFGTVGSLRVTASELDSYATSIRVTPVTPPAPAWQDGDVIKTTPRAQVGTDGHGTRFRMRGQWHRPNGRTLIARSGITGQHATPDARVTADVAAGVYTVVIRQSTATAPRAPHEFRVGDITRTDTGGTAEVTRIEGAGRDAKVWRTNGMNNWAYRHTLITAVEDRTDRR